MKTLDLLSLSLHSMMSFLCAVTADVKWKMPPINVDVSLDIYIIASWSAELVCLRAAKTKHRLSVLFRRFNYCWDCLTVQLMTFLHRVKKRPDSTLWVVLAEVCESCCHSLSWYHILEYWCHHTSLVSEIHHSPGPCNYIFCLHADDDDAFCLFGVCNGECHSAKWASCLKKASQRL